MAAIDWEDIKFLGAVARDKSARAAAKNMGVHHSTVSRRLESLEHATGAKLLLRTPEGYTLTEAGEILAATAGYLESEVSRAARLIVGGDRELAGRVVVAMEPGMAKLIFAPRLREFCARYPKLEVSILSSADIADLSSREADMAVRLSNTPDENLFGKRLFSTKACAYATPAYLDEHGPLDGTGSAKWLGWDGPIELVPDWVKLSPFPDLPVWGNFPDPFMLVELAASELGIAFLPCIIGDSHPELVRVPGAPVAEGRDVWVLTHPDLRNVKRIRAFMSFAEEVLREFQPMFEGVAENVESEAARLYRQERGLLA